jgi:nitrite reductase (NADH) large subunit
MKGNPRTIVVVGHGMVGARLCERLVEHGVHARARIVIFAEEPRPAYDRVHLTSYVEHRSAERLELRPASWYAEQGLELCLGDPVVALDRGRREVASRRGRRLRYDELVFATGSRPFVPPIPGATGAGVFVYRTLDDLDAILSRTRTARRAAVLGGGLLGLEAAQATRRLGLETHVLERAPFLMSQQLNEAAARRLEAEVRAQGITLRFGVQVADIAGVADGHRLRLGDGEELAVDMVILSAGIRPRTEVARDAGLPCDAAGGLIVDDRLQVEPAVFAIGECASHRGRVYGLVAPGYEMADVLAARLRGRRAVFRGASLSTRLKMMGVDVMTMGECGASAEVVESRSEAHYRALFFERGGLAGAIGVGAWPEAGAVQAAVSRRDALRPEQKRRFQREGRVWEAPLSVGAWSDDALVCNCLRITKGALRRVLAEGVSDPDQLARQTGASTLCGSCRPLLADLAGAPRSAEPAPAWRGLLAASVVALALAIVTACASPPAMAESVESWWRRVDVLWRDSACKQASGFALLGVGMLGLLLSLRKRVKRLAHGPFTIWRTFHAVAGVATLAMLFVHTGLRFGAHLNFWLMALFLAMNAAGALTGLAAALEARGVGGAGATARRCRPLLTSVHLYLSWPLPVLVLFHVLSVYLH